MRPVLLSLKPVYAKLVFAGLKRAELRRRFAMHIEGRDVLIYVSSPVCQVQGGFTVDRIWSGEPEEVWEQVKGLAKVNKKTFDAYYEGCAKAFVLSINDAWKYKHPRCLAMLSERFPDFVAPQSWRYLRDEEYGFFRRLKRVAVNGT